MSSRGAGLTAFVPVRTRSRRVDAQAVLSLREEGLSVRQIALQLGVSGQSVRNVLSRQPGAKCQPAATAGRVVQRIDRSLVARLSESGYSVGHIAQQLGVSCSSVRRIQLELKRESPVLPQADNVPVSRESPEGTA